MKRSVHFLVALALIILPFAYISGQSATSVVLKPFGGYVAPFPLTFPCTCTGGTVWHVTIVRNGAAPVSLNYTLRTQKYGWYTLPTYTIPVKGFYNPQLTQACVMYVGSACTTLPSQGMITPVVGSGKI